MKTKKQQHPPPKVYSVSSLPDAIANAAAIAGDLPDDAEIVGLVRITRGDEATSKALVRRGDTIVMYQWGSASRIDVVVACRGLAASAAGSNSKTYSDDEIKRRTKLLAAARKKLRLQRSMKSEVSQ